MIVFCSAPYRADGNTSVAENVHLAVEFSAFACRQGHAPINLMPTILAGGYGPLDDDVAMEAGIQKALQIVRMVAMAPGELWILLRHNGSLSSGCILEREVYQNVAGPRVRYFNYDPIGETFDEVGV